jgi:allantoinase
VDYDLLIRNGQVLVGADLIEIDVAVGDGEITALGPALSGQARLEIDATGLHVLPGGIDAHVHCDEPGRTEWEGFETASAALAAGGMTAFVDMPLNALPPTVDADAFSLKLRAAQAHSRLDFALWGGLVPGKLDEMPRLHELGVIGFKAFMSDTGMEDFRPADDATLRAGMRIAAELDALVAVHAEDDTMVAAGREQALAAGQNDARGYLDSRPIAAELSAISRAIEMAADTGCRLHVVHVSSAEGIELVRSARTGGVDVSCETATHFLALTDEDVIRMGTVAKCSPPMRDANNLEQLWDFVGSEDGIVASDHSPCAPELKTDDFFAAWAGINGCQATLGILLHAVGRGRVSLAAASAAVSANVAQRLRLPRKGTIEIGRDADITLTNLAHTWYMQTEELRYRHPISALVGTPLQGEIRHVFSRGRPIVTDGRIVGSGDGHLLRPASA